MFGPGQKMKYVIGWPPNFRSRGLQLEEIYQSYILAILASAGIAIALLYS